MSFPGQRLQRAWHLVDARGQTVGRLANQVASILKGKHKPTFKPNKDMGDFVVVVNAEKVQFSGNKWKQKLYRWHTGYPGGLKERPAAEMLEKNPTRILQKAILGMLKRNTLRDSFIKSRLRIYTGPNHPHTAQLPNTILESGDGKDATPVASLQRVPRKRTGDFFWGFGPTDQQYAHPESYQYGVMNRNSHRFQKMQDYHKRQRKLRQQQKQTSSSSSDSKVVPGE